MPVIEDITEATCHSWVIHCPTRNEVPKVQKEVDTLFQDYSSYPEIEWGQYGYRAPEGHQVWGAWRHPDKVVYAFLLDNPSVLTIRPNFQLLLYAVGEVSEIQILDERLSDMKSRSVIADRESQLSTDLETRLKEIHKSKSLRFVLTVLSVFTAIINAFSLYLRKLPPPDFPSVAFARLYQAGIGIVHLSSLVLLLMVMGILAIFVLKYGFLLIRKL